MILVNRAASLGRFAPWQGSMSELPWFGQYTMPYGPYGNGAMYGQPMMGANGQMPFVIQQAPGHSVVIQPNPGGVPTVQQVQGTVTSI